MTARKSTTTTSTKTQNPYDVLLIPGVRAKFHRTSELSPRASRELDILTTYLMPKLKALYAAETVFIEGEVVDESSILTALPVGLSIEETRQLFELNDLAAFTYLKSWTLRRGGEIAPLPKTASELQDLPTPLYNALLAAAAKIKTDADASDFSIDAVENPTSPTGA